MVSKTLAYASKSYAKTSLFAADSYDGYVSYKSISTSMAASLPVVVTAVEILRGDLVCSGYAWFFIAHPMVEWTEVAQIASLAEGHRLVPAVVGFVIAWSPGRPARPAG